MKIMIEDIQKWATYKEKCEKEGVTPMGFQSWYKFGQQGKLALQAAKVILLFLLFAPMAQANPFSSTARWVRTHKRFELAAGALVASSIVEFKGTTYCQRGDVERCFGGYGSRRGIDIINTSIGVGMLAAAEGCWKSEPAWKFCYGLAYGMPAYQTAVGIHDFTSYKPEHDKEFVRFPRPTFNAKH